MEAIISYQQKKYKIDLSKPLDLSMPLRHGELNVNSWGLPRPKIVPAEINGFKVCITNGAAVNANDVIFNPHAHATHTECIGHITEDFYSINNQLKTFYFTAELISIAPGKIGDDYVISKKQIQNLLGDKTPEALVIRTLPNDSDKCHKDYSATNPPFLMEDAVIFLREIGVKHLLVDIPSVDKEEDGGKLLAHKAFWDLNGTPRLDATITEFIFVSNRIKDGSYLLNLQTAAFENDASPSRPVLYELL